MTTTIKKPTAPLVEAPRRNRLGYYHTPYGRFLSVTTIIDKGVAKNLEWWYADEAAKAAIASTTRLLRARGEDARREAHEWIRDAAKRIKDEAAAKGSAIHAAINAYVLELPQPELTDEEDAYMEAFHRFVADWRPEWEASELVVANPKDRWAGQCDWWAWITHPVHGRCLVVGDTKTGKPDRKRTPARAAYPEAAIQLSAYQRATVAWLPNGTEVTPPRADRAVVLHIRPDFYPNKGYALVDASTSEDYYRWFLSARDVAYGSKDLSADAISAQPLIPPTPTLEQVA